MRTSPDRLHWRRGFTILELGMVSFIIILLVSILIPVISHVRQAGYVADTQQELNSISNAIQVYYNAFNAYPGPLDDGGNTPNASPVPVLNYTIDGQFPPSPPASSPGGFPNPAGTTPNNTYRMQFELAGYDSSSVPPQWCYIPITATSWLGNVTASENLVLALLGGLRLDTTTTPGTSYLAFAPDEVGLGPLSLNSNNPQRYSPFITVTNLHSLLGDWQPPTTADPSPPHSLLTANQWATKSNSLSGFTVTTQSNFTVQNTPALQAGSDTIIPEFLDRFPVRMPILYMRARVGAPGMISDGSNNAVNIDPTITGNTTPSLYQYDMRGIQGYTVGSQNGPLNQQDQKPQGFLGVGILNSPPQIIVGGKPTTPANGGNNAGDYLQNPTIAPTDPNHSGFVQQYYNHSGTPRSKDTYILISAGPDGVYGTSDDITSFGAVSP
jgi:type II secretory pathway pseudopilin PulG